MTPFPVGSASQVSVMGSSGRRPEFWRRHLPFSATLLPVFLLVICSGDVGDCEMECPLLKNGRLDKCSEMVNKTFHYSHDELFELCKKSHLQEVPQCAKKILEECQQMGYAHSFFIQNQTILWQQRFDKLCAGILEHHRTANAASMIANSCKQWSPAVLLRSLTVILLGLWKSPN